MVRWIRIAACLSAGMLLLSACGAESGPAAVSGGTEEEVRLVQLQPPQEGQETVVLHTTRGDIRILLYEEQAPQTVRQFKQLVEEGFYDGNPFFAVDPQSHAVFAGAADGTGETGATAGERSVEPEVTSEVWHFSGAVSAYGTRTGFFRRRIVSDSRFFILGNLPASQQLLEQMEENDYPDEVIAAYKKLGGCPQYTGFFTVFGQVIEGLDLVEEIVSGGVDEETGRPLAETVIESAELSQYTAPEAEDAA